MLRWFAGQPVFEVYIHMLVNWIIASNLEIRDRFTNCDMVVPNWLFAAAIV